MSARTVDAVVVELHTGLGVVTVRVDIERAPVSSGDFLRYVDAGSYDDGAFDRVVRPDNDHGVPVISAVQARIALSAVRGDPVAHELTTATGLRHLDGVLSLPRLDVGTGSAAGFFICVGDQPSLDAGGARNPDGAGFAAFGAVVDGMDVVRRILLSPCGPEADHAYVRGQVPLDPVPLVRARRAGGRRRGQAG